MKARRILGGAGILFAAGLLFFGRNHRGKVAARATESRVEGSPSAVYSPMNRPAPAIARPVTTSAFGHPNPIIENIRVDKLEVCRGEENFLHVDVTTVDGTERDVRITLAPADVPMMGGQETGGLIPIRLFGPLHPETLPVVTVSGWGGTFAERPIPLVKVKDCDAAPFLRLLAVRAPEGGAQAYSFQAMRGDVAMTNVTWSFGDGATTTAPDTKVVHDYSARRQDRRFSEFFVAASVAGEDGQTLRGYKTLELVNRDYLRFRKGS